MKRRFKMVACAVITSPAVYMLARGVVHARQDLGWKWAVGAFIYVCWIVVVLVAVAFWEEADKQ